MYLKRKLDLKYTFIYQCDKYEPEEYEKKKVDWTRNALNKLYNDQQFKVYCNKNKDSNLDRELLEEIRGLGVKSVKGGSGRVIPPIREM